ncbi:MAG: AzlD family protein [Rubrobacteraceae bacterium]
MGVDPITLLAIVLMALVTYATRAGGLWIAGRLELSERAEVFLEQIPGAILISLVAPVVVAGGPAAWFATLAAALVAWRTGSLLGAMVVGVGVVLALRTVGLS